MLLTFGLDLIIPEHGDQAKSDGSDAYKDQRNWNGYEHNACTSPIQRLQLIFRWLFNNSAYIATVGRAIALCVSSNAKNTFRIP